MIQIVEEVSRSQFKQNRDFLEKVKFFQAMTDAQKDSIARALILQNFKSGDSIISEGDQASSYIIIKSGTADCIKEGKVVRKLGVGSSFGEQALYDDGVRSLTVNAADECVCLSLSRDALQECLGARIQEVIHGNWARWAIEKNPTLCKLTMLQIQKWLNAATFTKVKPGEVVMEGDHAIREVVIVINGELKMGSNVYTKGSVFDDKFLCPTNRLKSKYFAVKFRLTENLVASEESEISIIPVGTFHKIIGGFLEEVIVKNLQSHEVILDHYRPK